MSEADTAGAHTGWRWATIALAIALAVLAFGAWWTYGLDRGGAMAGDMNGMEEMEGMPSTDVRLPPVPAYYDDEQVFFVHPAVSDSDIADTLTDMMGGSPVHTEPSLADAPDEATADVYVFENGIDGPGPLGHQKDVFPSAPGDDAYRSLREIVLVSWADEADARELTNADQVEQAETDGEVSFEHSGVIVNAPMLTWPDGER